MNTYRPVPSLIALAVIAALAGCGRSSSTPPSTTTTPPSPMANTPPSTTPMSPPPSPSAATPPDSTSSMPGSSPSGSGSAAGSSDSSGSAGSSSTPGRSSSLDSDSKLAQATIPDLRRQYGIDVTLVANQMGKSETLSRSDRNFLKDAAADGIFEVQAATIASERASDPAVKSFAEKLIKEHSEANAKLKELASSRDVDLPTDASMMKRHAISTLRKDKDGDFDRDFLNKIAKDHQADIKQFEKVSRDAKDPEVRAWAEKMLPTLREHLADAQRLQGVPGSSASR